MYYTFVKYASKILYKCKVLTLFNIVASKLLVINTA